MMVFISEMYTLDSSGMQLMPGQLNGKKVTLGVGGAVHYIRVFDSQRKCIEK